MNADQFFRPARNATYPSLVNARLSGMASYVTEFTLRSWHMMRNRNRLRAEVWERGLAMFVGVDGDGVYVRSHGLRPPLCCQIGGRAIVEPSRGCQIIRHKEVIQVPI